MEGAPRNKLLTLLTLLTWFTVLTLLTLLVCKHCLLKLLYTAKTLAYMTIEVASVIDRGARARWQLVYD